jgi:hypothetical protein
MPFEIVRLYPRPYLDLFNNLARSLLDALLNANFLLKFNIAI